MRSCGVRDGVSLGMSRFFGDSPIAPTLDVRQGLHGPNLTQEVDDPFPAIAPFLGRNRRMNDTLRGYTIDHRGNMIPLRDRSNSGKE